MKGIIIVIYISSYLNFVASTGLYDSICSILRALDENRVYKDVERRLNAYTPPESVEFLAGHTLIRPTKNMLISAIKYPLDEKNLVYGNLDNLGITFGDPPKSVLYSAFRKRNNLMKIILNAIRENKHNKSYRKKPKQSNNNKIIKNNERLMDINVSEEDDNSKEIMDTYSMEEKEDRDRSWYPDFRRQGGVKKIERNRDSKYISNERSDSLADSDFETNPGNPYTVHRNKYKQNWMWNHFMDGDHMNVNPLGPQFSNMGPTGPDLFFGRKWWYYNQDDYRPMG